MKETVEHNNRFYGEELKTESEQLKEWLKLANEQTIMYKSSFEEMSKNYFESQKEIERLKKELEIEKDISNGMLETIDEAIDFIYENAYDSERKNCIDDLWGEIPKLLEILKKEGNNESSDINREIN